MKKFLTILITFTLIIAIGLPYGVSFLLQGEYHNIIAELNTKQPGLEISGDFKLGWLTSSAKTHIKTKANNPMPFSLELEHAIKNGPIIVDVNKYKVKMHQLAIIETKIIGKAGLEIVTEVEYNGDLKTKIKNLPFQQNLGIGQIDWGGAEAGIKHNRAGTYFKGGVFIPKLIYKELDNILELQSITFMGEQQVTASGLWVGSAAFKIKHSGIQAAGIDVFTVDDYICSVTIREKGATVNYNITLGLNNAFEAASNNKVGPFSVVISLDDIDGSALKQARELGPVEANDPAIVQKTAPIWHDILLKQPRIKLDNAEFNLPLGKVVLNGEVKIGGAGITDINKPVLIKSIDAVLKVEIGKALAYDIAAKKIEKDIILEAKDFDLSHEGQSMPKPYKLTLEGRKEEIGKRVLVEMAKLVDEKFLIEKEKTFNTEIMMNNGAITVNGKKIQWGF